MSKIKVFIHNSHHILFKVTFIRSGRKSPT